MALGSRLWRPVPVDCWEWLEDLSPLAQRTWFWLWTGPTSTPHGVVSVRPYHAAGALKTKPSALLVALSELEQAGRIVMQQGSPSRIDLYLVGYLPAQCPVRPVQRRGIKKGIERVDLGLPTSQALEEWAIWDAACRKADDSLDPACAEPEPQQKQKQKQEQKPENKQETNASVAKATDTTAAPVVTQWALPVEAEPQAGEEPDIPWGNIQRTVPDEVDPNFRPQVKLTPLAQAKRDAADAARQQTLTLTPPKTGKTLTPGQMDAIFAKKRMAATVDLWNELLGKTTCGPCSHKEVAKMATQLMSNLAKYVSSEPGCDGSALIGWADAKSEYHSGRTGRTWTLQKWLTTEHLAQVFADYRNERGDERKIRYLPERTLRDWREAEEAREAWVNSQQGQVAA
jgi:hypothetical protein